MASQRIFGLNLFAFVLLLFLLVELNSSEIFNRNERSTVILKYRTSTSPSPRLLQGRKRYFSPIDAFAEEKKKPGRSPHFIFADDPPEDDSPKNDSPEDNFRIRRSPGKKPNRVGTLPSGHTRHAPPKTHDITAFPNLTHATPKGPRKRWVDGNTGEIFEWDSEKGELEKYNKTGKHLGSFDPYTGAQRGEAKSSRSIEP